MGAAQGVQINPPISADSTDADDQSSSNAVATDSGSSMSSTDAPSRNEPNTDTVPGVMVDTNRIRDVSAGEPDAGNLTTEVDTSGPTSLK